MPKTLMWALALGACSLSKNTLEPTSPAATLPTVPASASNTPSESEEAAIEAFWRWWPANQPRVEAWIFSPNPGQDPLVGEITAVVKAIHSELAWTFGPGQQAQHHFVVSGEGNPELRLAAERWLAKAPEADATFEFYAARQPAPRQAIDGWEFDFRPGRFDAASFRYAITTDETTCVADVVVHHPTFGSLPEAQWAQPLFVTLDHILGEDGVETWLRGVSASADAEPSDALGVAAFQAHVLGLAAQCGDGRQVVAEYQDEKGFEHIIRLQLPRLRWQHPLHHTIVRMELGYGPTEHGWPPNEAKLEELEAWSRKAEAAAGDEAVWLATDTGAQARRMWFAVTDPDGEAVARLRGTLVPFGDPANITLEYDPAWESVPHP